MNNTLRFDKLVSSVFPPPKQSKQSLVLTPFQNYLASVFSNILIVGTIIAILLNAIIPIFLMLNYSWVWILLPALLFSNILFCGSRPFHFWLEYAHHIRNYSSTLYYICLSFSETVIGLNIVMCVFWGIVGVLKSVSMGSIQIPFVIVFFIAFVIAMCFPNGKLLHDLVTQILHENGVSIYD